MAEKRSQYAKGSKMKYVTIDTGLKGAMILFEYFEPIDALLFKRMGQGIDPFEVAEKF